MGSAHQGKNSPLWFKVPPPPSNFVGREAELDRLHELLQDTTPGVVAITGMFGVGKSALVSQYLHHRATQDMHETRVFWINASSAESVIHDIRIVAKLYGIAESKNDRTGQSDLLQDVFKTVPKKSVFIFDGFEENRSNQYLLSMIIPPPECRVHTLVTTREAGLISRSLYLDVFQMDQALEFIRNEVPNSSEVEGRALAAAVGFLPIVLQDAAQTIRSGLARRGNVGYTIANFIEGHLDEDCEATFLKHDGVPMSTMQTLKAALGTLGVDSETPSAYKEMGQLILLAALRPEGATPEFLARYHCWSGKYVYDECYGEDWTKETWGKLQASGLVLINKEQVPHKISLHVILRKAIRLTCKLCVEQRASGFCVYLGQVIPHGKYYTFDPSTREGKYAELPPAIQKDYLLQAAHLLKFYIVETVARKRNDMSVTFLTRLHDVLLNFGLTAEAGMVATEGYALVRTKDGPLAQLGAKIQLGLRLAKWSLTRGECLDALQVLEEIAPLARSKQDDGSSFTDEFVVICYMGNAYCALGRLAEAELKFTEAIRLCHAFQLEGPAGPHNAPLIPTEFFEMQ